MNLIMKKFLYIFVLVIITSCSNWQYKDITYLKCKKIERIHVHLYYHESCEWNCLELDENYGIVVDTFRIKYRTNKEGNIKKVKLIK